MCENLSSINLDFLEKVKLEWDWVMFEIISSYGVQLKVNLFFLVTFVI
jgi:hypothetical protein